MRGFMVADALRATGHFWAHVVTANVIVNQPHGRAGLLKRADICVCLKSCDKKIESICRMHGASVVWDLIDVPLTEMTSGQLIVGSRRTITPLRVRADVIIANNAFHAITLSNRHGVDPSRVHVVYHHHSNAFGLRANSSLRHLRQNPSDVRILCFTANQENNLKPQISALFSSIAHENGMVFKFVPIVPGFPHGASSGKTDDPYRQRDILEPLLNCDAALIWPPDHESLDPTNFTIGYRPITRLATWWSLGIPTIFFSYEAYKDGQKMLEEVLSRQNFFMSDISAMDARRLMVSTITEAANAISWIRDPVNMDTVDGIAQAGLVVAHERLSLTGQLPAYELALVDALSYSHKNKDGNASASERLDLPCSLLAFMQRG
jgi:hypothetical protein